MTVVVVAIVPLALVALWVTMSTVRSGKLLLRQQLGTSLRAVAAGVEERWTFRRGELLLLADNDVARRLVADGSITPQDSAWLRETYRQFASSITSLTYQGTDGRTLWSSTAASGERPVAASAQPLAMLNVSVPLRSSGSGDSIGVLQATLLLSSIVNTDSSRLSVPGAVLDVRDTDARTVLTRGRRDIQWGDTGDVDVAGSGWMVLHRALAEPAIDLRIAAPTAQYTQPFARAGTVSIIAIMCVTLLSVFTAIVVAGRVAKPLHQLSVAAAAVASGAPPAPVRVQGSAEVSRLADAFNTMAESLQHTMSELSRRSALAAVGEFATSLAHEVRNALTSVRVDLQRAEEKMDRGGLAYALVDRSLFGVTCLDETVTAALRIARSGTLTLVPVDLFEVLQRVVARAEPAFRQRDATVSLSRPSFPADIEGDSDALEQLFHNLLINAVQAIGTGGDAQISLTKQGDHVIVRVRDSGLGIPREILPRVLEPFFTTREGGTGLGLPMAKQIAVAHRGELTISSEPGTGTTAAVSFPLRG